MTALVVLTCGPRPRPAAAVARAQLRRCDPPLRAIVDAVAAYYDVEPWRLLERGRFPDLIRWRHVAMALVRERTGRSFPRIGYAFGYGHPMVMYAVRHAGRFADDIAALRAILDAGVGA